MFVADSRDFSKPPVLLLHGFPTSSWDWHEIWDALATDYRLIAPDLLGFGFSDKPFPHRYRISEQAELVGGVLRTLGINDYHLIAHDYGDTVAQELLARDNGRDKRQIRSVTLLNGGLFPEAHRARLIQKLLAGPLGGLAMRFIDRDAFARSLSAVFGASTQPDAATLAAFWQLIEHNEGRRVMPALLGYIRERRQQRERWVAALTEARAPIKLINGAADPVSGRHMIERYREVVGEPDVVSLDGIGHYPQLEAPDAVAAQCQYFLSRLDHRGAVADVG